MPKKQNFALLRRGAGNAVLEPTPIPALRPDYILVRTVAVALNPTDWTSLDAVGQDGTIVGCDYAGIVEKLGSEVKSEVKVGDRVAEFAHGANDAHPENGAFARYFAVKDGLQMRIPDGVGFEEAATVGCGIGSAGYAINKVLGLPLPSSRFSTESSEEEQETVLIYGGSTATGSLAIQLAKLAGACVVTTCSPQHLEPVKQRGADLVYDYRDPQASAKILAETKGRISKILDTVSTETTAAFCAAAMGPAGGVYCSLLGIDSPRADVESRFFLGYSMSGEEYIYEGEVMEAQPREYVFACSFYPVAQKLWAEGQWLAHPQRVEAGGLKGIADGMGQMREGKVRGEKLVHRVEETACPGQ